MDADVVTGTTISRPISIVAEFAMNPEKCSEVLSKYCFGQLETRAARC